MLDVEMHGITAAQLNDPSRQDVVNALRGGLSTELLYELLRQFAVMNRHDPTILTDRDKVLYVEFEQVGKRVTLFIGDLDRRFTVYEDETKQVFALEVDERYEFVPRDESFVIERRRHDSQMMAAASHSSAQGRMGHCTTALYYHTYQDRQQASECIFRFEFVPAYVPELETLPSPEPIVESPVPMPVEVQLSPELKRFYGRLRPQPDPRDFWGAGVRKEQRRA